MLAPLLLPIFFQSPTKSWEGEVLYHIFVRSYRDSNHDGIGDFKGIEEGIPSIKKLGATAILLSPIQKSSVYHNYFADDFFAPDPEFGTLDQFKHLVQSAHKAGLKILLDMEPQYVSSRHPWYERALKGETNLVWSAVPDDPKRASLWYDKARVRLTQANLDNLEVRSTIQKVFLFWSQTGLDGYRIDHMMDNLDNAGKNKGLFEHFWRPIEDDVIKQFPNTYFLAEQSDWGSTIQVQDIFRQTPTNAAFNFQLLGAFVTFDKAKIEPVLSNYRTIAPDPHDLVDFLENHDLPRFATTIPDLVKQKLAVALLMTVKGIPSIYYGEELGMRGKKGNWNSDGNDIPMRLGYRWGATLDDPRTPTWYKNTGPWWSKDYSADHDGNSLPEQESNPGSVYNWFRKLITIRRASKALSVGDQTVVASENDNLLVFERTSGGESVRILANLSSSPITISTPVSTPHTDLLTGKPLTSRTPLTLGPWQTAILKATS
ncbi:MAG: DUF3459 domain-containing protein [Armatimonadetes bacterium]|nr:DUF3459 domain-containing protein [Armatimonadota bacterium]